MDGLQKHVQKLLRYKEDGTVEVHRRITEVPYDSILKARATPRKEDRLEEEDLPQWTKKAVGPIWS